MTKIRTNIKEEMAELEKRILAAPSKENTTLLVKVYNFLQNLLDNYCIIKKDELKNKLEVDKKEDEVEFEKYLLKCYLNIKVGLKQFKLGIDKLDNNQYQELIDYMKELFCIYLESDYIEEV